MVLQPVVLHFSGHSVRVGRGRIVSPVGICLRLVGCRKACTFGADAENVLILSGTLLAPDRVSVTMPGGELASGGAPARAQDATLQIGRIGATLFERSCHRPQYLQPTAPSRLPIDASDLPIRSGGARAARPTRHDDGPSAPVFCPERLNLTVPTCFLILLSEADGVA